MIAQSPEDRAQGQEQAGGQSLPVKNPHNHKRYLVVSADRLPQLKDLPSSTAGGE
jgi:hypothetical protein